LFEVAVPKEVPVMVTAVPPVVGPEVGETLAGKATPRLPAATEN